MEHYQKNGNGGAVTILPPIPVITGASLVHCRLDARQLACLAAGVLDGTVQLNPSMKQLAEIFGVSVSYIKAAQKLSPEKREAILRGWDPTSFAELVKPAPQLQLKLLVPNGASITNKYLETVIRLAGIDRVIEAAAQVESNS